MNEFENEKHKTGESLDEVKAQLVRMGYEKEYPTLVRKRYLELIAQFISEKKDLSLLKNPKNLEEGG